MGYLVVVETTVAERPVRQGSAEVGLRAPEDVLRDGVSAFTDVLDLIGEMATEAGQRLAAIGPDELELSFGLELGGEGGVPLFAKVVATGTIGVKLTWKRDVPQPGASNADT
jgi:hypothetical protein